MITVYFVVAGLTALAFVGSGLFKIIRPPSALKESGLVWVDDFASSTVRLIGAAETVGGLGLVLPVVTGIAPALAPVAGVALTVLMIGAIVVDARHRLTVVPALVLALFAIASATLGATL
ncbi:DoxX family protein [Rathayibacter sp. Leaf296]|uniref:DoxX family protein n=1 Tax=Rathayibacter sp. Leaf296 TaxID=1736327 RepID=UPI0007026EA1|nr:DoxX family protein [Rathayibacter sp. Leaf296]KQQ08730.1 DoxX family protein [Rathayibacter sp. Leaf296]